MTNDNWRVCLVNANSSLNTTSLLQHVADGYGFTEIDGDVEQKLARIREQLIRLHDAGEIPVLLVDDAHELNEETMRQLLRLSDLYTNNTRLLRVILFSEPLVEDILSSSVIHSMQQYATHTLEIPSLDETDTTSYILHRLGVADLSEYAQLFGASLVHKIHKSSHGIPLLINKAAREVLQEQPGYSETGSRKTWHHIPGNIAAMNKYKIIIALLMAVTLAYVTVPGLLEPEADSEQSARNKQVYVLARPDTVVLQRDEHGRVQTQTRDITTAAPDSIHKSKSQVQGSSAEPTAPLVGIHGQQPRVLPLAEKTASPVQHDDEVAKAAAPAVTTISQPVQTAAMWSEDWWRQQEPAHYTIMLLGSHTKQAVLNFIHQHQLADKAGFFHTRRNDVPWYVVVSGIYPDKQTALRAAAKLPAYPGTGKPWVRSVASVHADMDRIAPPGAAPAH
jgi:septal ring-binding cell division protein DamX